MLACELLSISSLSINIFGLNTLPIDAVKMLMLSNQTKPTWLDHKTHEHMTSAIVTLEIYQQ